MNAFALEWLIVLYRLKWLKLALANDGCNTSTISLETWNRCFQSFLRAVPYLPHPSPFSFTQEQCAHLGYFIEIVLGIAQVHLYGSPSFQLQLNPVGTDFGLCFETVWQDLCFGYYLAVQSSTISIVNLPNTWRTLVAGREQLYQPHRKST